MIEYPTFHPQKSLTVFLVGDACNDVYVYGTCKRISPEAPVPILDFLFKEVRGGMALNVAANLEAFGLIVNKHVNDPFSLTKTRYIDTRSHQQVMRLDETNLNEFAYILPHQTPNMIVISDYNKGFLTPAYLTRLIAYATTLGVPVYVDTKRKDISIYQNCVIKVNEDEYASLTAVPEGEYDLIVTKGKDGALWNGRHFSAPIAEAFDVTGAGDVFLASLSAINMRYGNLEKAIPLAIELATKSVQHPGTYTLTKQDISAVCF